MSETETPRGINKITVGGFKSIYDEKSIEIRPLTLLAGTNSSGKSSMMQPILLMKQTLEADFVRPVFRLDGPNVRYTNPRQFFSLDQDTLEMQASIDVDNLGKLSSNYALTSKDELQISETSFKSATNYFAPNGNAAKQIRLTRSMTNEQLNEQIPDKVHELRIALENITAGGNIHWTANLYRCFLDLSMVFEDGSPAMEGDPLPFAFYPLPTFTHFIQRIIHVPGLRDNPRRTYPIAEVEGNFEGTFENHFASVIAKWASDDTDEGIDKTGQVVLDLMRLELTTGIVTTRNNNEIGIEIPNKLPGSPHTINIADVGLGVSQVLPVLVALIVAQPGQLVYIEQPELHLHPRAQVRLAQILADAANRGVRVVVETHSSLLLLGLQTLIAEGKLPHEKTILHWFSRDENGHTQVDSVEPDANGSYGEWQEDFADVELQAQSRYMNAVEKRLMEQSQ